MNKNLKPALRLGFTIILVGGLGGMLLTKDPDVKEFMPVAFIVGVLIPAIIATVGVYYNKKYIIEDERLINMRQKSQSIWFNVMIVSLIFIPELAIVYANYIHNPLFIFGTSSIALDQLAWIVVTLGCGLVFIGLVGTAITYKVLMKTSGK